MALETLIASQQEAGRLIGIAFEDIQELQRPAVLMEGRIPLGNTEVMAFRAHSGVLLDNHGEPAIGKGGVRMAAYPDYETARSTVEELSVEMLSKLALRGYVDTDRADTYRGAKGLIVVDAGHITHDTKEYLAAEFEHLMEAAGLAGYRRDVPAGDVGTNGLSDRYALEYQQRNPEDTFWQASITGKSPHLGGLAFRTAATGWGSYLTQQEVMKAQGYDAAYTTVQGFGNVGAWHAYFATNDPASHTRLRAISDLDGMLYTKDPAGIQITQEMVDRIGNNPDFDGPKIHALRDMVVKNQRGLKVEIANSLDILTHPTDYFVPAAMGNVITGKNVEYLGARLGVIEAANGPTKPEAHRRLTDKHILVMPDIVANGAGVDCSIKERNANVRGDTPTTEQVKKELTVTTEKVVSDVLNAANILGQRDMRVAAAAVSVAYLFRHERTDVLRRLVA